MWDRIDRLGPLLADASLASATWLGLVALLMVGSRQPSRRCGLARAGVIGSLAIIPLVWFGPAPRIEVLGPIRAVFAPIVMDQTGPERVAGVAKLASLDPGHPPRGLLLVYLAGVGASLSWLVLGCWGTGWLARRSIEPSLANQALYRALPYRSLWGRPRLRVAPRVSRPVLLGSARATILIPPELNLPEARDQLRLSLLHELAHAERRDPVFSLAASLAQAIWFFLPPIWWIRAQMRLDQEFLADHRAAVGYGPFGTYASSLLDLAHPGPVPAATARARAPHLLGAGSALFQRVVMLVRCPFPVESHPPRWWRLAMPAAAALSTLLASGLTFHEAESPANPAPRAKTTFRLTRLDLPESHDGPQGQPYNILGVPLPAQFELTVDVLATTADLSRTRVVGYRLGSVEPRDSDAHGPPTWHHVRVHRGPDGVGLRVDEHPIPIVKNGPETRCLSVQVPPHRHGRFRNLKLVW